MVSSINGRDGNSLKEWLKNNKHIKAVTRDRASAYASAIQEVLPDAMQIADRFHLHQNLLEAIKNTVNAVLPVDIKISKDYDMQKTNEKSVDGKKMHSDVEKSLAYNPKSVWLYAAIHYVMNSIQNYQ